ncbi:hypothetical protein MMC28_004802 [Mycoblastus sanguinarius]|nr:hypothetical protein [Mycoblastus sanguinarius]
MSNTTPRPRTNATVRPQIPYVLILQLDAVPRWSAGMQALCDQLGPRCRLEISLPGLTREVLNAERPDIIIAISTTITWHEQLGPRRRLEISLPGLTREVLNAERPDIVIAISTTITWHEPIIPALLKSYAEEGSTVIVGSVPHGFGIAGRKKGDLFRDLFGLPWILGGPAQAMVEWNSHNNYPYSQMQVPATLYADILIHVPASASFYTSVGGPHPPGQCPVAFQKYRDGVSLAASLKKAKEAEEMRLALFG